MKQTSALGEFGAAAIARELPQRGAIRVPSVRTIGRILYLRRADAHGSVSLLGHTFPVDGRWPHRLVRCAVACDEKRIRFHALRRRDPMTQPLLTALPYEFPLAPVEW